MLRARPAALLALALLACKPAPGAPYPSAVPGGAPAPAAATAVWRDPPPVDRERLRRHLSFLADDAQEGRPPGTAADLRVQDHLEAALKELGLKPGFGDSYRQPFTLTDGVRLRAGASSTLSVGGRSVAHSLLPFARDTPAPAAGPLVYVGYGIPGEGAEGGDYKGLDVKGAIVVARAGAPSDPHLDPTRTRAQSKAIAARDRGAVGFILWEPDQDVPFPNHGEANDLGLPALSVTRSGSADLLAAFRPGKAAHEGPHMGLRPGARARAPGQVHSPVERVTLQTANLAGLLPGTGGGRLVLGAHMDHLGHGTGSSLAPGVRAIHNGADDNASGVAALLAVAGALAQVPAEARPFDLLFVAFGAEEMGLLGSKHLVAALTPEEKASLRAMLNFDMVGRLREGSLVVAGLGTSTRWPNLLERVRGEIAVTPSQDGFGASDQVSFYAAGVPVLHFFTGTHEDYHKPSDDLDKINLEGAAAVADLSVRLVALLLRERPDLDYVKVAAPTSRAGGFRVSLGTVPDYAAQVQGMKLAGVRPQSPAEAAGLKAGDVIIKIGAREIRNMDDYMAAFGELQPGVAVPLVVQRDGAALSLTITPAAATRR